MPVHPFTQQAACFTDVHGITGRADDGVHDVGGSARELSLWAGKWDNTSLLGQRVGFAPGRIAGKDASCSFALVGFSQASPSGSKAGDKRQGAAQKLSAAGRSLVRSGQICQSVGSVEAVVDSTCRQGAPSLHWSPACEFVRLPGGGWFGLPLVVSLLVLLDTIGFAKTLLAPQTVRPVRLGH